MDGRLRIWDATAAVPELLVTVPFDSGGAGAKLKAISIFQFCSESGLMVVGHTTGELRVYHFSPTANDVTNFEASGCSRKRLEADEDSGRRQPPGFQRVLHLRHHTAKATAVAMAASLGLVACADEGGSLSVVDLTEPAILWNTKASDQQITNLVFSHLHLESSQNALTRPNQRETPAQSRPIIIATSLSGAILAFEASSGKRVGVGRITPRTSDKALYTAVLDSQGALVQNLSCPLSLVWANNENTSPQASFATNGFTSKGGLRSAVSSPKSGADSPLSTTANPFHLRPQRSGEDPGEP